eukprot:4001291-Amphidinium_carterae.1
MTRRALCCQTSIHTPTQTLLPVGHTKVLQLACREQHVSLSALPQTWQAERVGTSKASCHTILAVPSTSEVVKPWSP